MLGPMQATVRSYDPDSRCGTLLLDDGAQLSFGADALRGSGLRMLRAGQRVHVEIAGAPGAGQVERLRI